MPDDDALVQRVGALEDALSKVRSTIAQTRTDAAMASMNVVSAQHALSKVRRELDFCRQELTGLMEALPAARADERDRLRFVVDRLDAARATAELEV